MIRPTDALRTVRKEHGVKEDAYEHLATGRIGSLPNNGVDSTPGNSRSICYAPSGESGLRTFHRAFRDTDLYGPINKLRLSEVGIPGRREGGRRFLGP